MSTITSPIKISPSILAADFANLADDINQVMQAGADTIHFDVMDNNFVPNLSFGAPILHSLRKAGIDQFVDVHLMVEYIDNLIEDFHNEGANSITVHYERNSDLKNELKKIKALGMKAGLAIKPNTAAEVIKEFLPYLDLILVMTVEPGFGGQKFMSNMIPKIQQVKQLITDHQNSQPIEIQVDGGISVDTIALAAQAGATNFVAGSAIFAHHNYQEIITHLRKLSHVK